MGCLRVSASSILPAARDFAIILYASNSGLACFGMSCDEDAWICRAPLKESPCIKEREACLQCYREHAQVNVPAVTIVQSFISLYAIACSGDLNKPAVKMVINRRMCPLYAGCPKVWGCSQSILTMRAADICRVMQTVHPGMYRQQCHA